MNLEQKYPNISNWIADGCVELRRIDYYTRATALVTDEGGTVWETDD